MLPNKQSKQSFSCVRKFAESMGESPDSFFERVNVLVHADSDYCYHNIRMTITYNYSYMDYQVSLFWEDDDNQPEYKTLDLHGQYSTNFQEFMFTNGVLSFTDGTNQITIMSLS